MRRYIKIGGVELSVVDKILRIYIDIGDVKPLVVDKILGIYFGIGGVEPLVVDVLRFFGLRGEVLWGGFLTIESSIA